MDLEIFIITYNRSNLLKRTLEWLADSVFSDLKITILNNSSTDDTLKIAESFNDQFNNYKIITHRINIGSGGNVVRAFELASKKYVWVLCDDDQFNFKNTEDLIDVINEGEVDLIHVGAHTDINWSQGGKKMTPKELIECGYHFFKAGSFLPCNIIKTEKFQKYFLIPSYSNIGNGYPHMPFIINSYKENSLVYLSKFPLVAAGGNQHYTFEMWFFWWLNTAKTMGDFLGVRALFFDHFGDEPTPKKWVFSVMQDLYLENVSYKYTIISFVDEFFTNSEKMLFKHGIMVKMTKRPFRIMKKFIKFKYAKGREIWNRN